MEPENKTNGALIGSIIIVIILIVGGVYLFKKSAVAPVAPQTENDTTDIMAPEDTSTSTEIEAELNTIDLDGLDSGL